MKVVCKRNDLLDAFSMVNVVIPTRSTVPVLQNINLTAEGSSLYIIGTDLEVGIKVEIKAEVKDKGSLLIPTMRLGALLRETADENIKIETRNNIASITTKEGEYKLVGPDPVDYPEFPAFDSAKAFDMEPKGVREMIHKTIFATSAEITRYALTGILVEIRKKEIRMVGSDGKRLAFIKHRSEQSVEQDKKVIVPSKGMMLLERVIRDDHKLKIAIDDTLIKICLSPAKEKHPETIIFSRLVDGAFPDYESIIPTDGNKVLEMKSEDLHSALRRATVVTTDKFKATKFILKDNKLSLLSKTQEVGEAKVEVEAKYKGEPFEIVFNPDFFIDALRVLGEGNLAIEFKEKTSPAVFKWGKDYVYLVMPLTIDI
ncbi:MAG: DNA polymerase III subunit beta [Planctomycetes bacterium]|nr:DNA polymerase III subunit beta [Planctomycetota bacterium]